MIPYFPLRAEAYRMALGTQALVPDRIIEIAADNYADEMAEKRALLADDPRYYFRAQAGTEAAQWEALTLLLPTIARHYPHHAALDITDESWTWHNRLSGDSTRFVPGEAATLPHAPLDWLGRQVQEDLLILDGNDPAIPLVAGQLCFANGWCLNEKMGQSFLDIHMPVALFGDSIGPSAQALMERLKPARPVWRINWSITLSPRLNLASCVMPDVRVLAGEVTPDNAGERCYFRIERQVLLRLPQTNSALFAIHSYTEPIAAVSQNPDYRRTLAVTLRTAPTPVLAYKGILGFVVPLLAWLENDSTTPKT